MVRLAAAVLLTFAALVPAAAAAPGDLDTSFGAPGGVVFPPNGNQINDLLLEPGSGKVLAVLGGATSGANDGVFAVARYNADGTLDMTGWASGAADPGVASVNIFDSFQEGAAAIARQADGKVVAVGAFDGQLALVRFGVDGSLDTGFNDASPSTPPGTVVTDAPTSFENLTDVAIQPGDQKIVAIGHGQEMPGSPNEVLLARYNPNGSLDTAGFNDADPSTIAGTASIDLPGITDGDGRGLLVDSAGRLLFAGSGEVGGTSRWAVARMTGAGLPDPAFGDGGTGVKVFNLGSPLLDDLALELVAGPGGTVVAAGAVDASGTSSASAGLARLGANGALDPSFGNGGLAISAFGTYGYASWLDIQPDGRLVAAGSGGASALLSDSAVARFSSTGAPDPSFGSGGLVLHPISPSLDSLTAGVVQPDGRIVVGGAAAFGSETVPAIARFMGGDPPLGAGSGQQGAGQTDVTRPSLRSVSMLRTRFRVGSRRTPLSAGRRRRVASGTAFRFTLSEPARVRILIERRVTGRRVGRSCRRPSHRLRNRPRCTRHVRVGSLARPGKLGRNSVPFSGRLGRRALRAGSYRATLQATDQAGLRSPAKRIRFRVVR